MAKKTLPPIVLPVVRIERYAEGGDGGPCDLTNVVDINAYRYARQRRLVEQPEPETTTPRSRKGSLLRQSRAVDLPSDVGS